MQSNSFLLHLLSACPALTAGMQRGIMRGAAAMQRSMTGSALTPLDLETPGTLQAVVKATAKDGELVLLHADGQRLLLLANLIAQLEHWNVYHTLVLGFEPSVCAQLRQISPRTRCVVSSYLQTGPLAEEAFARTVPKRFVAWLQRMHCLKRLLQQKVSVLALDTDISINVEPYAALRPLRSHFAFISTFDFKGGFANVNIGFIYLVADKCGRDGPVLTLFEDFERRIASALRLFTQNGRFPRSLVTQRLWDQNVFNKALLSAMARPVSRRDLFLPDGSDANWTRTHRALVRARNFWKQPADLSSHIASVLRPPAVLAVYPPLYPKDAKYLWYEFNASQPGGHGERVLLVPSWLVSLENGLGDGQKHVLYGATPPASAFTHYTCVSQSENARAWPMRLFGHWRLNRSVSSTRVMGGFDARGGGRRSGFALRPTVAASSQRESLLALDGGSFSRFLTPRPWPMLNAIDAFLGAVAVLTDRRLVLPVLNCTTAGHRGIATAAAASRGSDVRNARVPSLPSRCFWHVHSAHGVGCVYRVADCPAERLATPDQLERAMQHRASNVQPPTLSLDLARMLNASETDVNGADGDTDTATHPLAQLLTQQLHAHAREEVLMLKLQLPEPDEAVADSLQTLKRLRAWAKRHAPSLASAMRVFEKECPELVKRVKGRSECTNVCS